MRLICFGYVIKYFTFSALVTDLKYLFDSVHKGVSNWRYSRRHQFCKFDLLKKFLWKFWFLWDAQKLVPSLKSFFCRNEIRNTQLSIRNTLTLHENWLTSVISNLALKNAFFTAMKTKFLACTLNIILTQRGSKLSCQLWSFQLWIKKPRFYCRIFFM